MTLDRTIAHATPLDNADLIDAWLAAIPVDANRQRVSDLLNETLRTHPNLVLVARSSRAGVPRPSTWPWPSRQRPLMPSRNESSTRATPGPRRCGR